ncbi:MAG TPA: RsiV family protein [Candidatus Paceibacterota bacterium]
MNWNKDIWIGVGVLAIIGVLLVWFVATHPAPVQAPTAAAPTGTATSTDQTITDHEQYYTVDAVYPGTTPLAGLPDSADVNAVALMKQWELDTIAQFKTDSGVANLTPEDIQMQGLGQDGRKYALGITYQGSVGARTVTYVYQVFEDTLGAHPNGFYHTFTFDTQTGQNLALKDLFYANAPYLARLSDRAKTDMPAIIAKAENVDVSEVDMSPTGMLMSGITPTEDNFANFAIDGTDLVIIFQPYQIGPWALGTQTDRIPLADLKDILKPDYQPQ